MWYPEVRYVRQDDRYLELFSWDGTYRGVIFRSTQAADAALKPGRAEIDCSAVSNGFLPLGAELVSRPAWRPDLPESGKSIAGQKFAEKQPEGDFVTEQKDATARRLRPRDAARYEAMALAMAAAGRSQTIPRALLAPPGDDPPNSDA